MTGKKWRSLIAKLLFYILCAALAVFGTCAFPLSDWYAEHFGVTMEEIAYTLAAPMKGADMSFMSEPIHIAIRGTVTVIIIMAIFLVIDIVFLSEVSVSFTREDRRGNVRSINAVGLLRVLLLLLCILEAVTAFIYGDKSLKIKDYLLLKLSQTSLYADHYVDPVDVDIEARGATKNLIYIYVESLETTYASVEAGGMQPENNYIEGLTKIAQEEVSFSDSESLGGFIAPAKTGWTMAGILASSGGVPFAFPVEGNSMDQRESFASGLTTLGDILRDKGYEQEFLCGSDSVFGGRRSYFTQHGGYEIFDYYTAIEKGYIPDGYKVWWGFEDRVLYEIAKDEVTRLSEGDKPFNLTMLTVDTHHVDGYICELCEDEYPDRLANVVSCTDRQLTAFIEWCREQPFYNDTTIVITGDHRRMDTSLVEGLTGKQRTIYNCFINASYDTEPNKQDRVFTTMDIFPSVLSAMGYDIEGDRLGLGTDMFSGTPTLAEELGYDILNGELKKYSSYYIDHFS